MATIAEAQAREYPAVPSGVWSWITTVDHKRIGTLYFVSAIFYFLIGGLEALLMRIQLSRPENTFLTPETYNQLFTMHGTTMIFLVVMPLTAAFFNWLVPLMIGARDVAFPRLNAFSYWTFFFGALLLNAGFLFGAAPDGGWFGYANLTSKTYSPGLNIDFWLLGLQVLGVASLAAAFNFIVTIINLRAPGMTLMRMPVFVWMTLITSFLMIFAFPAITVALILLGFDRFFHTKFYDPLAGGDPILWQHLFWIFGHPEVYILILPAFGIISEVLPTFSRKPLFGYTVVVFSGVAIAFLGFSVWAHHMFTTGMGAVANAAFSGATMLIAVPTGIKIFNWLATCWGGQLRFPTPMLFALSMIGFFTIGGLTGPMHAAVPVDMQQQDTYFVVAHFHYVLFGGSLLGLFAGIYYWFPKISGKFLDEGLGKLHFWLTIIGLNATFFPMHFLGVDGMPRRIYTYPAEMGGGFWNAVVSTGAFVIALATLVFLWNLIASTVAGKQAGSDPWDGRTLEWTIPSPPPHYNFAAIPTVTHRDQHWVNKYGTGHRVPAPATQPVGHLASGGHNPGEPHDIHMPNPSFFPLLVSMGLFVAAAGMMVHIAVAVAGVLWTVTSIYAWALEPAAPPVPHAAETPAPVTHQEM